MSHRTVKLKVEPTILRYARYSSGYQVAEAARKAGVAEGKLILLEKEGDVVSLTQLEKFANLYKRPLAYFLLEKIPKDVILPKGFRIIYASPGGEFSPAVVLAVRRGRYVQSIIQELNEENVEYNLEQVSLSNNIEKIALSFRLKLGITVEDQSKWSNPSVALKNWKSTLERLGIFILQQSLPQEDVSAFCLVDQVPYIIVLNSSEHENRRVFSLFHEIGHILLHRSGICTPDDFSRNSFEYIRIEKFCNQFAASLLVPYNEFIQDSIVQKLKKVPFKNWHPDDIRAISARFGVSQEVIYRRLMTVGVLNESEYNLKRHDLIKGFLEYKKKGRSKEVKIPQYRKIISRNGQAYVSFVLGSLHSNRITLVEAASFLDTNSRHVFSVEAHM